jgi:CubicO group peptidase (beta-lactamase class C family)
MDNLATNRSSESKSVASYYLLRFLLVCCLLLVPACEAYDDEFDDTVAENGSGETAVLPPTSTNDADLDINSLFTEIVAYVAAEMEEEEIPGAAIALIHGPDTILADGLGLRNLDTNAPVTANTLFHIASASKPLTSFLIATLVEQGQLDWDQPLSQISSDISPSDEPITLRHLLTMTSGLPEDVGEDIDHDTEVFPTFNQTRRTASPGDTFQYSNLAYAVAGYLAVQVAHNQANSLYDGYAQLMQERVFNPLNMNTATVYFSEARRQTDYARAYAWHNGRLVEEPGDDYDGDPLAPSGAIKASALDMAQFIALQLNEGVTSAGQRIISADTLHETWQPVHEGYGLGWQIEQYEATTIIYHTGFFDNFAAVIGFLPEYNLGFVLLTNAETGIDLTDEAPFALVDLLLNP